MKALLGMLLMLVLMAIGCNATMTEGMPAEAIVDDDDDDMEIDRWEAVDDGKGGKVLIPLDDDDDIRFKE